MLLCFGSFIMMPGGEMAMCDVDHRGERAFVSRGGIKLENALTASGLDVARQARAGRGRLDGRVHGLPAAARRRGRDGGGCRLRAARLGPAQRSARERARAHERARADRRHAPRTRRIWRGSTCRSSRSPRSCRRCSAAWPSPMTCSRWSSPSSRSAARASAKGGVVRDPATAGMRLCRWVGQRSGWGRACSAITPPDWRGRRATKRRSCGWPRRGMPAGPELGGRRAAGA